MCLPRPLWCLCIKIASRTRVLERRETCRSRGAISTTFLTDYCFQFYKLDTVDTEKFWFDSSFCHRIYLLPFFFSFCYLSLVLDFEKNENLLKFLGHSAHCICLSIGFVFFMKNIISSYSCLFVQKTRPISSCTYSLSQRIETIETIYFRLLSELIDNKT